MASLRPSMSFSIRWNRYMIVGVRVSSLSMKSVTSKPKIEPPSSDSVSYGLSNSQQIARTELAESGRFGETNPAFR